MAVTREIPPLVAVRAFEAVARHLSVTRAAEELHVTPAAVSHQIRVLEQFLGADLFVRSHRQLSFTLRGKRYFDLVSGIFNVLRLATDAVRQPAGKTAVKVRAKTSFSLRWLIPRFSKFYASHRDIDIELSISNAPVNFDVDDLDFAIRLGNGEWAGCVAERLVPNVISPVCSPALLKGKSTPISVAELADYPLLKSVQPERRDDWVDWLKIHDGHQPDHNSYLAYEGSAVTYQAAIEGQGIAMAQLALVQQDLIEGRLIRPLSGTLDRGNFTFYLIYPASRMMRVEMQRFRDWLIASCRDNPSNLD